MCSKPVLDTFFVFAIAAGKNTTDDVVNGIIYGTDSSLFSSFLLFFFCIAQKKNQKKSRLTKPYQNFSFGG